MEDVEDARELVERRMRDIGFESAVLDKVMDLLRRFDNDREKLFEEMLSRLEQPNCDGLKDRWSTNCQQAEALMERLEDDLRSVLKDSQANALSPDERWNAVGPRDFLAGERKVWAQVARLDVPDVAVLMSKILEMDIAIIKKCEEDLKSARSHDAVVQKILQANFATVRDRWNGLVAKYGHLETGIARLVVLLMKDPSSKNAAGELIQSMEKANAEAAEAANLKYIARQLIVENLKILEGARAQLDEDSIDRLLARGAESASSWRSVGATGDYRATDWDWMKENVIDRGLDTRAEDAKEQSSKLFDDLYPTYVEELEKAFAQLTDDPEMLAKLVEDVEAAYESLEEILKNETDFVGTMSDGDAKQKAREAVTFVLDQVRIGWRLWRDKTKDSEDKVKK